MTQGRPTNGRDSIHPEYLARAAREAVEHARFWIPIDRADAPPEGHATTGPGAPWADADIAATAFDPVFRIVLDAMLSCRLARVTPKLMRETGAPQAWLARYATGSRGVFDVDVSAEGVRDDLSALWWLASSAEVVIHCDLARLDTATLFNSVSKLHFAAAREISAATLSYTKVCAAAEGTVALVPRIWRYETMCGWSMLVVAARELAGELAKEVFRQEPRSATQRRSYAKVNVAIHATIQAATYWADSVMADDVEKYILSALRRCMKFPTLDIAAIRGLAAAEGVAIAEGRAAPKQSSLDANTTSTAARRLKKGDPLAESTIELAIDAVQLVAHAGLAERTLWLSDEARLLFRAELDGLRKRLLAARVARRARA